MQRQKLPATSADLKQAHIDNTKEVLGCFTECIEYSKLPAIKAKLGKIIRLNLGIGAEENEAFSTFKGKVNHNTILNGYKESCDEILAFIEKEKNFYGFFEISKFLEIIRDQILLFRIKLSTNRETEFNKFFESLFLALDVLKQNISKYIAPRQDLSEEEKKKEKSNEVTSLQLLSKLINMYDILLQDQQSFVQSINTIIENLKGEVVDYNYLYFVLRHLDYYSLVDTKDRERELYHIVKLLNDSSLQNVLNENTLQNENEREACNRFYVNIVHNWYSMRDYGLTKYWLRSKSEEYQNSDNTRALMWIPPITFVSVIGFAYAGAIIGTLLFPGIGTFVGTIAGIVLGMVAAAVVSYNFVQKPRLNPFKFCLNVINAISPDPDYDTSDALQPALIQEQTPQSEISVPSNIDVSNQNTIHQANTNEQTLDQTGQGVATGKSSNTGMFATPLNDTSVPSLVFDSSKDNKPKKRGRCVIL